MPKTICSSVFGILIVCLAVSQSHRLFESLAGYLADAYCWWQRTVIRHTPIYQSSCINYISSSSGTSRQHDHYTTVITTNIIILPRVAALTIRVAVAAVMLISTCSTEAEVFGSGGGAGSHDWTRQEAVHSHTLVGTIPCPLPKVCLSRWFPLLPKVGYVPVPYLTPQNQVEDYVAHLSESLRQDFDSNITGLEHAWI